MKGWRFYKSVGPSYAGVVIAVEDAECADWPGVCRAVWSDSPGGYSLHGHHIRGKRYGWPRITEAEARELAPQLFTGGLLS